MNPQYGITLPLGVAIYYLAKIKNVNGEHANILKSINIKVNQIYFSSQTERSLIIHQILANTTKQNMN